MLKAMAIMIATMVYVVFPIDFVPDFIPVLGQCDDLMAFICGVRAAYEALTGKGAEENSA